MENYTKGETREIPESCLPLTLDENAVKMKVNYGSKIRNLMGFAIKKMKEPPITCITWEGSGNAISKTVTCAEIMKRKIQGLHQFNYIRYRRTEEYWDPDMEGLDRLKVNRDVPVMTIVLSKLPLDTTDQGYQLPDGKETFWNNSDKGEKRRSGMSGNHRNTRARKGGQGTGASQPPKQFKRAKRKAADPAPKTDQSGTPS